MNYFGFNPIVSDGVLSIGGVNAETLRKDFGTPLYVFDVSSIRAVCRAYTGAISSSGIAGAVAYASKAFCCKAIYRIINEEKMFADVVSGGELFTALKAGFPSDKLIFHGNNKSDKELFEAVNSGVKYIVIDNFTEAEEINRIAEEKGVVQAVFIRVNPGVEAHTHHFIQTATADSKFGFSIENGDADKIISAVIKLKNLSLDGLHCHIGSQIFEIKSFRIAVKKMSDYYKKLKSAFGLSLKTLDIGGGFGIRYTEDDKSFTEKDYSNYVKEVCAYLKTCAIENDIELPFLIFEPGRSIVGEAGYTLYTAGEPKIISGVKNYLPIDGGMFDNPRFALYQARYTVCAASKMNDKPNVLYTIAGKCCESGDVISENCYLPEIKKGDLIAVFSTGAYNYSMASNYNRNLIPPVVFVEDGKASYAVKPQNYEDLLRNDL